MQKLMGDEGWGGGLFFSTDPKCLWFFGTALMKIYRSKINPFWKITWFPWLPIMQCWRIGVFGDPNEQFGTHEKLS